MQYNVHFGETTVPISAEPTEHLSALRRKLHSSHPEVSKFQFLYFNTQTGAQTIVDHASYEHRMTIGGIVYSETDIEMAQVKGRGTDFFGDKVDSLQNSHAKLKVSFNETDSVAIAANKGKFKPLMLGNVRNSNPNSSFYCQNALICEIGSIIEFEVTSWGAAGFGYSIESMGETLVKDLYHCADPQYYDQEGTVGLRRYQDSDATFKVDSLKHEQIPEKQYAKYSRITLKTWRVTSYKYRGSTYANNEQAPEITAGFLKFKVSSDDPTSGGTFVNGHDVRHAAPQKGPSSNQQFNSVSNIKEDNPNTELLGAVTVTFFVFTSKEAANRTMKINGIDGNAIK